MWKFLEKRPFFRADMAGLGKCCTGGYGRIGVYRVKTLSGLTLSTLNYCSCRVQIIVIAENRPFHIAKTVFKYSY